MYIAPNKKVMRDAMLETKMTLSELMPDCSWVSETWRILHRFTGCYRSRDTCSGHV